MMKIFPSLLCFTILIGSAALGDDLPRDWVEASDGFVWPESPEEAPVFKVKSLKLESLEEEFRKIAKLNVQGPQENIPEHVSVAEVDLNCDGKEEIFLRIPRLGGSGGYFFLLYTRTEDGYRSIGHMQVVDVKFLQKHNGWYQIETSGRGGAMDYTRVLHTFEKEGYEKTRLEDHNLWKKTMVVKDISKYR